MMVDFHSFLSLAALVRSAMLLTLLGVASPSLAEAVSRPVTVLELFTSQSCSKCPEAEVVLHDVMKRDDVIALAYHIDYWDYLGWQDTFALPINTKRQKGYSKNRGNASIYTPQVVVNGGKDLIGSEKQAVLDVLSEAKAFPVNVQATLKDMMLEVAVSGEFFGSTEPANVYLIGFMKEATQEVVRMRNSDQRVFRNVVRSVMPIGVWSGGEQTFKMPKMAISEHNEDGWVVLVQLMTDGLPGEILGATYSQLN